MKILSVEQLRAADLATVANEPISSVDLMERAALVCVHHLEHLLKNADEVMFICGRGNNGGDGVAIARLLHDKLFSLQPTKKISVFILPGTSASTDFLINLERIKNISSIDCIEIEASSIDFFKERVHSLSGSAVLIDCIFGTGLNKPVTGIVAEVISILNLSQKKIISIDIPSGMFADVPTIGSNKSVIQADLVLTFHSPKLSFLFAENAAFCEDFISLDIGLAGSYIDSVSSKNIFITQNVVTPLLRGRNKFSHKGTYGHALLVCGSEGMLGAAVLSVSACLRSGAGLVTVHVPSAAVDLIHRSAPEALVSADEERLFVSSVTDIGKYNSIGLGPGLGTYSQTASVVKVIIQNFSGKLVLDADALNILSENRTWLGFLRSGTILTPHPKEFDRLFGAHSSDFSRLETAKSEAARHGIIIVLKGAHTAIVLPSGFVYFNSTGNAGMAKGGCGDVLTGLLTGLLARGYSSQEAAVVGVYLHGLAGDLAREELGVEAMKAGDLIDFLPKAFNNLGC
jgi:ADP-dependent NAD(P)H-hydrate dehydratase / NAD(P)H-hydrate epimerase